jgi:hypothetical protein
LNDDDIVRIFYPLGTCSASQKLVAIAIGRAIAARTLREAGMRMDKIGVCTGALVARAIADEVMDGSMNNHSTGMH